MEEKYFAGKIKGILPEEGNYILKISQIKENIETLFALKIRKTKLNASNLRVGEELVRGKYISGFYIHNPPPEKGIITKLKM
jgi:hypothetical protein